MVARAKKTRGLLSHFYLFFLLSDFSSQENLRFTLQLFMSGWLVQENSRITVTFLFVFSTEWLLRPGKPEIHSSTINEWLIRSENSRITVIFQDKIWPFGFEFPGLAMRANFGGQVHHFLVFTALSCNMLFHKSLLPYVIRFLKKLGVNCRHPVWSALNGSPMMKIQTLE